MQIYAMEYAKTLTIDEVTEIADKLVREGLEIDLEEMEPEEINELLESISDAEEIDDDEEIYKVVLDEVNNFPAVATAEDFVKAINNISTVTGIDNAGLWWEVIEECLALRIGRKNNCLA